MDDLKSIEEFDGEIEQANWLMLEDHFKRGALFSISSKLKLSEVANAFSRDYTSIVKIWLDDKDLRLVDKNNVDEFSSFEKRKAFNFLIVQPYVITQLIEDQ